MARKKPEVRMVSYGLYTPFEKGSKELPHVLEFTETVPARVGVEFGYILEIRKARGATLSYTIEHPPFRDEDGNVIPPFEGDQIINANDYQFFLGDTLWPPVEDKTGEWTLRTAIDGETVAEKTFNIDPAAVESDTKQNP
jgi:hypothetical protein